MEQLNRIELKGNVGNVRISDVGGSQAVRFSLATNFVYRTKEGEMAVETTWHNITAWSGKGMPDFRKIIKGTPIHAVGRLRTSRYTGSDGMERQTYEIVASRLSIMEPGEALRQD